MKKVSRVMLHTQVPVVDVICMNNDAFDGLRRPRHILMQLVAQRGGRVLFVSTALNYFSQRRHKNILPWGGISTISNRLYWLQPLAIFRNYHLPWLDFISLYCRTVSIEIAGRWLGLNTPILYIAAPHAEFLKYTAFHPKSIVVYNVHDRFLNDKDQWVDGHAELLQRANIVLCGSKLIQEEIIKDAKGDTYLFPPALDLDLFKINFSDNSNVRDGGKPLIGCIGSFGEHIDWELLDQLATSSMYNFLFVGPVTKSSLKNGAFISLKNRANVEFRDTMPHDTIPALIQKLDICILPYRLNEYTKGINPLKILEYLAFGKIVIGSPIPSIKDFGGLAYCASTITQWQSYFVSTLDNNSVEQIRLRKEFANRNSYHSRLDFLFKAIEIHKNKCKRAVNPS